MPTLPELPPELDEEIPAATEAEQDMVAEAIRLARETRFVWALLSPHTRERQRALEAGLRDVARRREREEADRRRQERRERDRGPLLPFPERRRAENGAL